jgi:hypothetical protein
MVAVELEVLAKKFDRFGWDRDRGSMAHDRAITDWMDALQEYPLDEVKAACKAAVLSNPNKMPNEGHVRAEIMKARAAKVSHMPKLEQPREAETDWTPEAAQRMEDYLREFGFTPRRFGGAQ